MANFGNKLLPAVLATALIVLAASAELCPPSNATGRTQSAMVQEVARSRSAPDGHGDAFGDSIWAFPINESLYAVGVEFAWNEFFVTCGMADNRVNVYDRDGNWFRQFPQFGSGGWRDMAWDGDTLYAAAGAIVVKFGPNGEDYGSFTGGDRALAYDPGTGHFWTAGWGSPIYEFDKTGAVHNVYPNAYAITGMTWDDVSMFAPCLWVAEMTTPAVRGFDPSTGIYNPTLWFPLSDLPGGTTLSADWDTAVVVLFQLLQSTPDRVNAYEIERLIAIEERPVNDGLSMTESQLLWCCPNPFTHTTTIRYSLPDTRYQMPDARHKTRHGRRMTVAIYDVTGRLVKTLFDSERASNLAPDAHSPPANEFPISTVWDGRDNKGRRLPSGVYFARLVVHNFACTRKMTLLR